MTCDAKKFFFASNIIQLFEEKRSKDFLFLINIIIVENDY